MSDPDGREALTSFYAQLDHTDLINAIPVDRHVALDNHITHFMSIIDEYDLVTEERVYQHDSEHHCSLCNYWQIQHTPPVEQLYWSQE